MLGGASPSSPTQTPLQAFDDLSMKLENDFSLRRSTPDLENSQYSPLRSPSQRGISTPPSLMQLPFTDMGSTTTQTSQTTLEENNLRSPTHSFVSTAIMTSPRTPKPCHFKSPDQLSIVLTSHRPRSSINTEAPCCGSSQTTSRENTDELLLFSQSKPLSPDVQSSTIVPSSPRSPSQISLQNNSCSPSSSQQRPPSLPHEYPPSPSLAPPVPRPYQPPPEVVRAVHEQENTGRYSLRGRKPIQVRPFTGENAQYQAAMRSIPEAIVKQRTFDARGHRHNPEDRYEDDETQKGGYAPENNEDEWEGRQRRRREEHSRATGCGPESPGRSSEGEGPSYPSILQDIPSTDEEGGTAGGLTKDDRKFLRERKRQRRKEKEREKEEQRLLQEESLDRRKKSPRRQLSAFPVTLQAQPSTSSRVFRRSFERNDPGVNLVLF